MQRFYIICGIRNSKLSPELPIQLVKWNFCGPQEIIWLFRQRRCQRILNWSSKLISFSINFFFFLFEKCLCGYRASSEWYDRWGTTRQHFGILFSTGQSTKDPVTCSKGKMKDLDEEIPTPHCKASTISDRKRIASYSGDLPLKYLLSSSLLSEHSYYWD